MKNKNIIWIILGILLLSIILYLVTRPEKTFTRIELTKNNFVLNRASESYLDTIVSIGMDELNMVGLTILIRNMESPQQIDGGYETQGYIVSRKGGGSDYLIYIKKGIDRNKAITVLSHELIHLKQYQSCELIWLGNESVIWKENEYTDITQIPYMERGWEIEAFEKSPELNKSITDILYER